MAETGSEGPDADPQCSGEGTCIAAAVAGAASFFPASNPDGQHLVRLAARTTARMTTTASRHDVGGIERVDVEIGTSAKIRRCIRELPGEGPAIAFQLRSGAASSPMRRFYRIRGPPPRQGAAEPDTDEYRLDKQLCRCPPCEAPWCSAGRWVRECPHFSSMRLAHCRPD